MHERDLSSTSTYVTHHLGDLINPPVARHHDGALGLLDVSSARLDPIEVDGSQRRNSGGTIPYDPPQNWYPSHSLDFTLRATSIAVHQEPRASLDGLRRTTKTTHNHQPSSHPQFLSPVAAHLSHLSFPPAPTFPRGPAVSHHPTYYHQRISYPSSHGSAPPFNEFRGASLTGASTAARIQFEQEQYEEYDGDAEEDEPSSAAPREQRGPGHGMSHVDQFQHGIGYARHTPSSKMTEARKARRIRRLEKEFGKVMGSSNEDEDSRAITQSTIKERVAAVKAEKARQREELETRSGVDAGGRLIVSGPKKRMALKWGQALGATVVGFGSIGASTLTHPISTPPPRGTAPLYALFFLPLVSLASTIYLFVVRPILYHRHAKATLPSGLSDSFARMVLHVQGGVGNARGKGGGNGGGWLPKSSRGSKRSTETAQQPVVNVFVDPTRLNALTQSTSKTQDGSGSKRRQKRRERARRHRRRERKRAEPDHEEDAFISTSSETRSEASETSSSSDAWSASGGRAGKRSRKALLSVVLLEERWKAARSWAKKVTLIQGSLGILWSGVGIWAIGFGQRCTPGTREGYCNLYNLALAFTALTAASFLLGLLLNLVDLHRTRCSPRLRQQRHGV